MNGSLVALHEGLREHAHRGAEEDADERRRVAEAPRAGVLAQAEDVGLFLLVGQVEA